MKNLLSFSMVCLFVLPLIISSCTTNSETKPQTSEAEKTVVDDQLSLDLGFELQSILNAHPEAIGMLLCVEGKGERPNAMVAVGKQQKGGSALSPNQTVLIASNTKTYVSAAILRLTELHDLTINTPIGSIISAKSAEALTKRGYNLEEITVAHLLSHTSGIRDYAVSDQYFEMIKADPKHRWSRDEQINLAMQLGDPLGSPGWGFSYADVNFLLATEIIEHYTKKEFYTAMRELLKYQELGLKNSWFY
ncbi:MAG: serine hydrolase domain-containing protein, partial [Flavobacteriales bacterium]